MSNRLLTPKEFWGSVKKTTDRVAKKQGLSKDKKATLWVAIRLWLGKIPSKKDMSKSRIFRHIIE